MPRKPPEHGTPGGYRKHLRDPEEWGAPCAECRAANARGFQDYRASKPPRDRTRDAQRARARRMTLNDLADMYPVEFDLLFEKNLKKLETSR